MIRAASGLILISGLAAPLGVLAQQPVVQLPPVQGFAIVMTLTMKIGDRESVHVVQDASPTGFRWIWNLIEVHTTGDTLREEYRYAELNADIKDSKRFWAFHEANSPGEHPGYTMHAFSRSVYRRIRAAGSDSLQIMTIESPEGNGMFASLGLVGGNATPVRWRGTMTLATPAPVPFPVLVNGQRTTVAALHLRGAYTWREKKWAPELWILADSTYPLLLKWVGSHADTENVLQTTRIDFPSGGVEAQLTKECRAELPGIYFAFNSAILDTASNRAIASVAEMLGRHADWSVTLEGHTDSIGSATANRTLSERRVAAVRDRLVSAHRIDQGRLRASGFGSARPREPNTTIEGRARNRRVELVRECTGSKP